MSPLLLSISLLCLTSAIVSQSSDRIHLKYEDFDPVTSAPRIPEELRSDGQGTLWIVQFSRRPTPAMRDAVRATGARLHSYLPDNAYVVRMPANVAATARSVRDVRWVGRYEPAYRIEPFVRNQLVNRADMGTRRYNIVVVDKRTDKPALARKIAAIGGRVEDSHPGSLLLEASLGPDQLLRVAAMDEVLWLDRWSPPVTTMNNARVQGGADSVEAVAGLTGQGIRGHVYEGIEANHEDFTHSARTVLSSAIPSGHGHCTAGIIAGNGTSHPDARGIVPDAQMFYTNFQALVPGVSRWQVVRALVEEHDVMFTSASWGHTPLTTQYTSISADSDDIVFDHDIPWTQSQGNESSQLSLPQAWAKNLFSIGGVHHFDNSNPTDDSYLAGSASRGPSSDGRVKPDFCAYYDAIHCSDLTGAAGYAVGNSNPGFGGTSGAAPMVAGLNALAIQMFTDGLFGQPLRVPGGTRFANRPHFTTLKALQIANARQYPFTPSSIDNLREHQGWGFPSVQSMYDNRDVHVIIDETDVLTQGDGTRWLVNVAPGRAELKISMTHADPAANPAALFALVNDLSLRVLSPSLVEYHGNVGLDEGNESVPGGTPDTVDNVENVFVIDPDPGIWSIEVRAPRIAQDGHVETTQLDADYALVVNGGVLAGREEIQEGAFAVYGSGCGPASVAGAACQSENEGLPIRGSTLINGVEFVIEITARQDLRVIGFDLWTGSRAGSVDLPTVIRADDGIEAPGPVLVSSTMPVGSTPGYYTTTFANPVSARSGTSFFVGFRTVGTGVLAPNTPSGTTTMNFFTNAGSGWNGPFPGDFVVRVNCAPGAMPPVLTGSGEPATGRVYAVSLAQAAAHATAALSIGASNRVWSGTVLPLSLEPAGATGCSVLSSLDLLIGGATDGNGMFAVPLTVPDLPALVGGQTFHQFFVIDPAANPLGLATSHGGRVTIGN